MQNTVNPNATEKAKVLLNFLSETAGKREKSLCSAGLKCWHIRRTSMITMRQKPALLRFMKIEIPWKLH